MVDRVLLVHDYGTPTGGAEVVILGLRVALRERGIDARLLSSSASLPGARVDADFVAPGTLGSARTLLQCVNVGAWREVRRALRSFRPNVVHVRTFLTQLSPTILPPLEGVPAILHVADYRPICPLTTKRLPNGSPCFHQAGLVCRRTGCVPTRDVVPLTLQAVAWRRRRDVFDAVVANSEHVAGRLRAEGFTVDGTIPNGVPRTRLRAVVKGAPTVAFAGRLVDAKGVDVLLRSLAIVRDRVPDVSALIAGDGPARDSLGRLATDLGLERHVSFLGHLDRGSLERRFASAWVQVVPSTWEEPFGLVAAEAAMRGTAVVASSTGGLAELVKDGVTGLLVAPGDPAALADALGRLLSERDVAAAMGRAGHSLACERFDENRIVDRFLELYDSVNAAG